MLKISVPEMQETLELEIYFINLIKLKQIKNFKIHFQKYKITFLTHIITLNHKELWEVTQLKKKKIQVLNYIIV